MADRPKHLFLLIEIPSMYVADIDGLREFAAPEATESEHILNCIGEPSAVRLTTEISGEKDSDVISVYGLIHSAAVREASFGFGGTGTVLSEDEIEEHYAEILEGSPDDLVRDAVERLRGRGISDADIADELRYELKCVELGRLGSEPSPQRDNHLRLRANHPGHCALGVGGGPVRPNEVEVTLPPDDLEPVYLLGRVETPCGSEVLIELRDGGWGISFTAGGSPGFSFADPTKTSPPPAVEEALWQAAEALMTQDLAGHPDFPTAFAEIY